MSFRTILTLSTDSAIATTGIHLHSSKFSTNFVSRFSSSQLNFGGFQFHQPATTRRRRSSSSSSLNASFLELPLLPFNTGEVLVPSESKVLHLYEARYLALLEESLLKKDKLFVHFVLDPINLNSSGTEASFAARYGCLVFIESVERLDVGALISIRGIGRVKIASFSQSEPYLRGEVIPMQDSILASESTIKSKLKAVKEALYSLTSLEIKLKAPKEALLQTRIASSLTWAEKEPSVECDKAFIPSVAERVSFTALQPITGSTQTDEFKLQRRKLKAMDLKDTVRRLDNCIELVNENISIVAAKLAIQSVEMQ